MKAKILWIFVVGSLLLTASCRHHWRNHNRMVMNDGTNRVEVRYEGNIEFNDDETAISRISRGGYLEYSHNDEHLLAGITDRGVLEVDLTDNGKPVDASSAEGKALLSRAIRQMINMGFDIDGRVDRIYRKGGYPALLSEVDSVDGDYVRGKYLERILDGDSLPAGIMARAITRIRERVGGDYDKARLLKKVDTIQLKNDSVSVEYLAVVKSMGGDYEKSEAMKHYLEGTVATGQYISVLEATGTVGGDYEKSNVLKELIGQPLAEGKPFDSLLNLVGKMGGDYEKGELLKQIVLKNVKENESWAGLIRTTTTLGGEYERSNVLIEIGGKLPKTDSLRNLYMDAAKTVHSNEDYGRVVKAMQL
jgi:hypothetical protein